MEVGVDPVPRRRFWTWEDHSRDRKTVKDELKKVKKHLSSYFAFSSESQHQNQRIMSWFCRVHLCCVDTTYFKSYYYFRYDKIQPNLPCKICFL